MRNGVIAGPPLDAGCWSAWAVAAGEKSAFSGRPMPSRRPRNRSARPSGRDPSGSPACSRRWRSGLFIRPVLKHGPRSLTCMRAGGRQTHVRRK
ncbi:hypothetical protein Mp_zg00840 [Marchantia polymorpha subsp. ruderalis]|uniref:Uncharacterized protein n=1 Tax=Marchantia polymorpha subsp. ruderalis TaxID=1480154 RepID=A0A679E0B7_MARPO|nr:hypothetical protein Mp_2g00010 [Marchantia polymorpha subsp. ruderalis]BBN20743.1 hypothetical protein Mp_zg00840 [Marchantia polymorpha subsp. ruderalis]